MSPLLGTSPPTVMSSCVLSQRTCSSLGLSSKVTAFEKPPLSCQGAQALPVCSPLPPPTPQPYRTECSAGSPLSETQLHPQPVEHPLEGHKSSSFQLGSQCPTLCLTPRRPQINVCGLRKGWNRRQGKEEEGRMQSFPYRVQKSGETWEEFLMTRA